MAFFIGQGGADGKCHDEIERIHLGQGSFSGNAQQDNQADKTNRPGDCNIQ